MRFVPRSHLHIVPHAEKVNADNMLSRGQEIAVEVDEADTVDDILAPGQFSLHHEQLIHGSNRNTGSERRIGLAIRYLRPTARQVVEDKDTATLVRGVDPHGNFEPERRPAHDMEPAAVDYLEALLARRGNGVFALRRS
jgi:non-heme Fe2+,alpha-ketoglutarate-dependent halogenase